MCSFSLKVDYEADSAVLLPVPQKTMLGWLRVVGLHLLGPTFSWKFFSFLQDWVRVDNGPLGGCDLVACNRKRCCQRVTEISHLTA